MRLIYGVSLALALTSGPAWAQDQVNLDSAIIRGNSELPKVLYIVPWKAPAKGDVTGRPLTSVVDDVLVPIDRDVFRRQMQYQSQQQVKSTESATKPVAR